MTHTRKAAMRAAIANFLREQMPQMPATTIDRLTSEAIDGFASFLKSLGQPPKPKTRLEALLAEYFAA